MLSKEFFEAGAGWFKLINTEGNYRLAGKLIDKEFTPGMCHAHAAVREFDDVKVHIDAEVMGIVVQLVFPYTVLEEVGKRV